MSSRALDVDKTPPNEADARAEASRWQRHAIYRVPAFIRDVSPKAYRPQVVSLGPFHHGDTALLPMEAHKGRAQAHLLRRCGRPLEEFRAAMRGAAEQLETAYRDLGVEWRGDESGGGGGDGYASSDPVFSRHGVLYVMPFIRRDMLMLENQLPLLELERLVTVMTAQPPPPGDQQDGAEVSVPVVTGRRRRAGAPPTRRLPREPVSWELPPARLEGLTRHLPRRSDDHPAGGGAPRGRGPVFKRSWAHNLRHVRFRRGVLSVPALCVDDSTEYALLNMMGFERLHAGAGSDVAAYVFFMSNVLGSARDVTLLRSEGIVQNAAAGSDKAVAQMFERMSKDAVFEPEGAIDAVHRQVNAYCRRRPWRMCGSRLKRRDECLRTTKPEAGGLGDPRRCSPRHAHRADHLHRAAVLHAPTTLAASRHYSKPPINYWEIIRSFEWFYQCVHIYSFAIITVLLGAFCFVCNRRSIR
ncbi:unnamed protein product [Miscanthus lutarioriparius]|uniref:Uncharacterized protein n=1 Tax=Miscanthus lutarioriparius TaxID=422564 RepID=A0A811QDA0_9POAL|nr:unnamed protein product [Miscanthus lutarioriparius]